MDRLKAMFPIPNQTQRDMKTHGRFLYEIHNNYIRERGCNMDVIRLALNIQQTEPEAEDEISNDDMHTSSGMFTVENPEDRRVRYLNSGISEVSSPFYW